MGATMNPREQVLARRLTAAGLTPRQVKAGVEGRRQAVAQSWKAKP